MEEFFDERDVSEARQEFEREKASSNAATTIINNATTTTPSNESTVDNKVEVISSDIDKLDER